MKLSEMLTERVARGPLVFSRKSEAVCFARLNGVWAFEIFKERKSYRASLVWNRKKVEGPSKACKDRMTAIWQVVEQREGRTKQ